MEVVPVTVEYMRTLQEALEQQLAACDDGGCRLPVPKLQFSSLDWRNDRLCPFHCIKKGGGGAAAGTLNGRKLSRSLNQTMAHY